MSLSRRFAVGTAMVSLGNALIAGSHVLDQTMVGPSTAVVTGSAMAGGVITYLAVTSPDTVDFERSGLQQYFATIVFVGGAATVFAGIMLLTLAVVE